MSMIVGEELYCLVISRFLNCDISLIDHVSLDVRLGNNFELEDWVPSHSRVITTQAGEKPRFKKVECNDGEGVFLPPNAFMQAMTLEYFNMPNDVSGVFFMSSTLARSGINQATSTLLQPGWSGNLVLEIKNYLQYSEHQLFPGQHVGQIVFHKHASVKGYSGKYNNQTSIN